jgi:hypothetical protein
VLLIGACGVLVLARRYRASSARATAERQKLTAAEAARLSEILRQGEQ